MRRALGQSLRLRHTPELTFVYDEGLEAHDRIARLLDEVHAADAVAAQPDQTVGAPPEDDLAIAPEDDEDDD